MNSFSIYFFLVRKKKQEHGGIPKIIHQSWKDTNLPPRFEKWRKQWLKMHPDYTFMFWTDEDNRKLVMEHYPWLLTIYDAFPKPIMRADLARILYMHKFGGVYVDLDFEPLRPIDSLLENETGAVLAYNTNAYYSRDVVPNAFLASVPNHHFWNFVITKIIQHAYAKLSLSFIAEQTTGPHCMRDVLDEYTSTYNVIFDDDMYTVAEGARNIHEVTILAPGIVYPFSFVSTDNVAVCHAKLDTFDETKCKELYPNAYMITYWQHSWQ
jgi:mannosyltransferase OCH1-like enzyme